MYKFFLIALFLFAAINWFLLPMYPGLRDFISPLTVWAAMGLSGCLMIVAILFGDGK